MKRILPNHNTSVLFDCCRVYPDYYTEIKRPMSLARIKSKIKKSRYRDLNHCFDDFRLMFNNCLKYNRVDSQIYRVSLYSTLHALIADGSIVPFLTPKIYCVIGEEIFF